MASKKYFGLPAAGQDPGLISATQVSTGVANGGDIPALGDNGKFDASLIDATAFGMPDVETATASEALAAGDLVNTYNNGGVNTVRKAVATSWALRATGFVLATASANDATVKVYKTGGTNMQVTGLTVGTQYLSATTPGKATATFPTTAGQVQQIVGNASSATGLHVALGPAYGL